MRVEAVDLKGRSMAVPKSWSSDISPTRTRRYFTLEEANRTIPFVSRVVTDIVQTHERAANLHAQLENRGKPQQRILVEEELEKTVDRLNDLVDELKTIGCELKEYRLGLVDFIAKHDGREICLCWKLGEDRIDHWHELHAGFQGRQPVQMLHHL